MYIVLGTALDGISMIVLTTAVVPDDAEGGVRPGLVRNFVVLIVEMAEVSPPVGFNLFVLQTMSGRDSNTVALASLPFFFLLVASVAIITIWPQIVMVANPNWLSQVSEREAVNVRLRRVLHLRALRCAPAMGGRA